LGLDILTPTSGRNLLRIAICERETRKTQQHNPSTKVREIAAMLKAIHASEDIVAAREQAIPVSGIAGLVPK